MQMFVRIAAAGFDGGIDVMFAGLAQQGIGKFVLHEGLTAGECHAAAGTVIEHAVLFNFIKYLTHRHGFAVYALRARGAGPHTGKALAAFAAVMRNQAIHKAERARSTGIEAAPADLGSKATRGIEGMLGMKILRLGVTAPAATQRTTLEKNQGADTFAIVHAELLYIKNNTLCLCVSHGVILGVRPALARRLSKFKRGRDCSPPPRALARSTRSEIRNRWRACALLNG